MLCKNMGLKLAIVSALFLLSACSQPEAAKPVEDQAKAEPAVAPKVADKAAIADSAATPADVQTFIERREGCDHFRGEEGYDEERAKNIREQLDTLCTGSDAQLAALKAKYAGRADVMAKLSAFEETIE